MSIYRKVKAVEKVFDLLERDINTFRSKTSLKCLNGCGECCKTPEIEASVVEFLPFAYHLYKENKAYEFLEKWEEVKDYPICGLFSAVGGHAHFGMCSNYRYRGLVCRLFGYSAFLDKYGKPKLSTCKIIKEHQLVEYQRVVEEIDNGAYVPVMKNYYFALMSIDQDLAGKRYPINLAIKKALEHVCFYYAYRGRRSG